MKRVLGTRGTAALIVSTIALVVVAAGTSFGASGRGQVRTASARTAGAGPVTRTFSYIAAPGSKTKNVVNIDQLTINARCGTSGQPIIFAFSSASAADIFGRVFDGLGRIHTIHNTSFNKGGKGIALSTSSGDFDASSTVLFETSTGKVVTVQMAFDNSTTLSKRKVCTVYGSSVAT
jgi:hypothetical protein